MFGPIESIGEVLSVNRLADPPPTACPSHRQGSHLPLARHRFWSSHFCRQLNHTPASVGPTGSMIGSSSISLSLRSNLCVVLSPYKCNETPKSLPSGKKYLFSNRVD